MKHLTPFVDWISLSLVMPNAKALDKFIEWMTFRLLLSFDFSTSKQSSNLGGRWSRHLGTCSSSLSLQYTNESDSISVRILLPGEFLATHQRYYVHRVMGEMFSKWGAKCTRIDLAVDDDQKQLNYDLIIDAIRVGNMSGFSEGKHIDSFGGTHPGRTVYCGSRRSAKYARFYNRGEVDRFEVEYKQDLAASIFLDYVSADISDVNRVLSEILKSSLNFIDKRDKNISRNKPLDWWTNFLGRIQGDVIDIKRVKRVTCIQRTMAWIRRSVSKSILKCEAALGVESFAHELRIWVSEAANRVTNRDNMDIAEFILFTT
jgi:DNA relaxase NicK